MNIGVLQLDGDISVLSIMPALPLPLPLPVVATLLAYWLISLSCRLFFPGDMTVGDFPGGNRRCRKRSR